MVPTIERRSRPRRRGGRWLLAALLTALLSLPLWWLSMGNGDDLRTNRDRRDELVLLEARIELVRSHLDEITTRILEPFGITDAKDIDAATAERLGATSSAITTLEDLAEKRGKAGNRARLILEIFGDEGPARDSDDPWDISTGAGIAQFEGVIDPQFRASPMDSMRELAFLDQPLLLGLHEAIAAHWFAQGRTGESATAQFLTEQADFVRDAGGYLGPDADQPLTDGWLDIDTAVVHATDEVDRLQRIAAGSDLWASDQWIRGWATAELGPAPTTLDALAPTVEQAIDESRAVVDARIDAEQATIEGRIADNERTTLLNRIAASILIAIALGLAAIGARALQLNARQLRNRANTDALTGAGNRNMLDEETAAHLADDRFAEHAVVMIDMDRFKVVNDSHGHGVGDRLLRTMTEGLHAIATSTIAAAGTVVRLGGDEFLLSLHHDGPIDIGLLRSELDALRRTGIQADDALVRLEFSYGVASTSEPSTVRDLMDAADLQAYEQKAHRASRLQGRDARARDPETR